MLDRVPNLVLIAVAIFAVAVMSYEKFTPTRISDLVISKGLNSLDR